MTNNFGPQQVHTSHVEAFCADCGVIQPGKLLPAVYIGYRRAQKQMVVVHCTECGAITRHEGTVHFSSSGKMSVIPEGDDE